MDNFAPNKNQPISSEDRLKALLTATSDVVYSLSPDWSIMYELDGRGFLVDANKPTSEWKSKNVYHEDIKMVDVAIVGISAKMASRSAFKLSPHFALK